MSANPRHHNVNVSGSVYYALAPDGRLFHYADTPPSGAVETNIEFVEHVVEISDVRWSVQAPRLDVEGATLSTHRSAVRNFYDADELLRVGYPEVADLVRTLSGAADVVVFDHNIRRGGATAKSAWPRGIKPPVSHIHTDFTGKSAVARLAAVLGAIPSSTRRVAAINVWRPLVEPLRDHPLAICDASSVEERDLLATDLLYPHRTGEINYLAFNAAHRWCYASDMRTDEVWLFKNFDSATDGRARFTPHTAFIDPTYPHVKLSRESVEFRTFAFFPEGA